jgi:hypothetical protein
MTRGVVSVVFIGLVGLVIPGGCKKGGGEELGTVTCRDVKSDVCVDPTDQFEATAPVVHMTYKTRDLPKNGDVYEIKWIAEDVGEAAPANTAIDTVVMKVDDVVADTGSYTVNGSLTRPTEGWPVGKYRVEVKLGDELVTTARFAIVE